MIIQNIKTGKQYAIDPATWEKLKLKGKAEFYAVVQAPEKPIELKNVRAAKAPKNPETDNNGVTTIDDGIPSQDVGEAE